MEILSKEGDSNYYSPVDERQENGETAFLNVILVPPNISSSIMTEPNGLIHFEVYFIWVIWVDFPVSKGDLSYALMNTLK